MERKLLSFYKDTCGPCKIAKPTVAKIAENYGLPVERIDVATMPGMAQTYGVSSVPTLILLDQGEEVARLVGAYTYMRTASALGLTQTPML